MIRALLSSNGRGQSERGGAGLPGPGGVAVGQYAGGALLVGLVCAGILLRFWRLGSQSLAYDEVMTGIFYMDAPDILTYQCLINMYFPEQAPLFYWLEYVWVHWFGASVVSVRLLPLVLNVVALPLAYLLASRVYGRTAGVVATVCYTLSPIFIWWSQGARAYAVMAPLGILFLYTLIEHRRTEAWPWGCAHLLVTAVMLWVSLTTVFLIGAELCFLLVCVRGRVRGTIGWGAAMCLLVAPAVAWVWIMPHVASRGAGWPRPFTVLSAMIGNDSMHLNFDIPRPYVPLPTGGLDAWMNWGLAGCFVVATAWLMFCTLRDLRRVGLKCADAEGRHRLEIEILFLVVILLPAVLAYVAAVLVKRNLLFPRYTMYTWPVLYACLGACIAALPRRWLRCGAVIGLIGLYAYQIPFLMPTTRRADWLSAGEHIRARASANDVVLVTGEFLMAEVFEANMRWSGRPLDIPVFGAATSQAAVDAALWYLAHEPGPSPSSERAVWLLVGALGPAHYPAMGQALNALGLVFEESAFVAGDTILAYRIRLPDSAAGTPEDVGDPAPVRVAEPTPYTAVDYDWFLDEAFVEGDGIMDRGREGHETYKDILRRMALHMYDDPMDPMVWSLHLMAAGQEALALAASNVCLNMSSDYSLGHLARGLALEGMGRSEEAREAVDKAFAGNFFLKRVFSPFISAYLNGGTAEAVRIELCRLERMGLVWLTPALWTLYCNRFEPRQGWLPLGVYAPRERYYAMWAQRLGRNPQRSGRLSRRAQVHLDHMAQLVRSGGAADTTRMIGGTREANDPARESGAGGARP